MPLEPAPLLMAGEIYPPSGGGDVLPNYWNPSRGQPDVILPSATSYSFVLTFPVGSWSAWIALEPALAADYVLACLALARVCTAAGSFWVQLALGPGSPDTIVATVGQNILIAGSGAYPWAGYTLRLPPKLLPAGQSLFIRGRAEGGSGNGRLNVVCMPASPGATWYSPWPNTYIGGSRVTAVRRVPDVPNWVRVAGNATAWTEVVASAPNDMLFTGAEFDPTNGGGGSMGNRLEVAVGPAGSEVVYSRVPFPSAMSGFWPFGYQEVGRKSLILAGERVSARLVTGGAGPWRMGLYLEDL